jgi:hypothetical protein
MDGHRDYLEAVEGVKLYGESPDKEKRYSPAEYIGSVISTPPTSSGRT